MVKSPRDLIQRKVTKEDGAREGDGEKHVRSLNLMRRFNGIVDRKGRLQFASEAPVKELGYTEDDILRKPFWQAGWFSRSEQSQKTIRDGILGALGGESVRCEVQAFAKDGTAIPVTLNISPLKGKDGDIVSIVAEAEAIERGERIEMPIAAEQQAPSSLLDLTLEAYFETDNGNKLRTASPSAARLLGYESPDELIGKRMAELWTDAEERDKYLMQLSRRESVHEYKAVFRRKDGQPLQVELNSRLTFDSNGEVAGSEGVFRDTTASEELQELKEKIAWLESFGDRQGASLHQAYDPIAIVQDGVIKFASNRLVQLLGYERDELEGIEFTQFMSSESAELERGRLEDSKSGQDFSGVYEVEFMRKDGTICEIELSTSPAEYDGAPAQFNIFRDISGRRQADNAMEAHTLELEETNEQLRQEIAGLKVQQESAQDLNAKLKETNEQLLQQASELKEVSESHGTRGAELEETNEQIRLELAELREEQDSLRNLNTALKGTNQELQIRLKEFKEASESESTRSTELEESSERLQQELAALKETNEKLQQQIADLEEEHGSAQTAGAELKASNKQFQKEIADLKKDRESLQSLNTKLRETNERLQQQLKPLQARNAQLEEASRLLQQEITKRGSAEEDMRESERLFRTVFSQASSPMALVDLEGRPIELNSAAEKMLGYTSEECRAAPFTEFVHPDDTMVDVDLFADLVSGKRDSYQVEKRYVCKDGRVFRGTETASLMRKEDGEPEMVITTMADVSESRQTEEALRDSEERYRDLVEVARDAIIGLSRDGIITSLNPAFETITGRGCSEWVDKELADILHPDDVDSATEILKSVQEGEMPAPSELRLRSKSGKYVIAEVTATPIIKEGTVVGISVIARDVTDRKRAEEAMKESDEYFRSLLGDISEGVTVLNADGTIRYQSPSAEKLFGYNADEHLGKIAWDFVHPDDASAVLGALEGLMREPGATMSMECRYRSADGSWRNMECSARNCVDDPVIQGIIVNSRDVTDQSRAEEALARSESYYRSLIENVSESIHIVNGDGTIRYVAPSSERVNGYRPEELVGEDGFKFLHPDDVPKAVSLLSEIKKKPNATVSVEVRFCHKDGSVHYVEAVGVNRLDDPAVGGIVVNSRDVTERRQLTEKLEHGEEYYRSLVENNAADVTIINANGTIQYKSPTAERAYGFEPSQMIGKNAFEFVHPDDLTRVTHTLDDLMHNPGATETIECRQRLKGAIWRYIEITATNLLSNPAVAGIVLNQRDITEYRETEKRLKESEMRLKDLLENLKTSQEELSTPVVQIWDHILALPLVGVIDTHRAKQVMDVLLTKITELRAQVVVIDVTGVATMDTQVTNHLIQTAQSTRLLGAECVITGIKPEVAQTMVHIGADMTKLITKRDLQEGLRYGLTLIGYGFREEHVETVEQG